MGNVTGRGGEKEPQTGAGGEALGGVEDPKKKKERIHHNSGLSCPQTSSPPAPPPHPTFEEMLPQTLTCSAPPSLGGRGGRVHPVPCLAERGLNC